MLLYNKKNQPIFNYYKVDKIIESTYKRCVNMPSGGHITIEPTEALTSIDVNSGKSVQHASLEDTALNTNLEAMQLIAEQIRFRNINGIIIVDTIDMKKEANRLQVEQMLIGCLKQDKAKTYSSSISDLGIIQISRQNVGNSLLESRDICRSCSGQGRVLSKSCFYVEVVRTLKQIIHDYGVHSIEKLVVHIPINNASDNIHYQELKILCHKHNFIFLEESPHYSLPDCVISLIQKPKMHRSRIEAFVLLCIGYIVFRVLFEEFIYISPIIKDFCYKVFNNTKSLFK